MIINNLDKEIQFYDGVYARSTMYNQNPEKLVYYPMWKDIVRMAVGKIIELGCGVGHLAQLLIENQAEYIAGYDFSKVAIEKAQNRNPTHVDKFHVKDIYQMEMLPSGHTIIATETLEHLENDSFLIDSLPNGTRFIFSVPNFPGQYHYHVFKDEQQIRERYKQLTIHTITRYNDSRCDGWVIFLVDSTVCKK